jgi:hypothetical protein
MVKGKLLDLVRDAVGVRHSGYRTEQAYREAKSRDIGMLESRMWAAYLELG